MHRIHDDNGRNSKRTDTRWPRAHCKKRFIILSLYGSHINERAPPIMPTVDDRYFREKKKEKMKRIVKNHTRGDTSLVQGIINNNKDIWQKSIIFFHRLLLLLYLITNGEVTNTSSNK